MVTEEIDDDLDKRDKQLRELERARKRSADRTKSANTTAKHNKILKCKWCDSTSHKTKRSKDCPYNPNYVNPATVTPVPPAATATPAPPAATVTPAPPAATVTPAPPAVTVTPAPPPATVTSTSPTATAAPVQPPAPVASFSVGDNVFAKVKKQTYLGQVVGVNGDKYRVYFVDNGEVEVIDIADLRPERFPTPKRREFLNLEFYVEGEQDLPAGRWKVRRIVDNAYVCTRLTGGTASSKNVEEFDIGYVMREIKAQGQFFQRHRRSSYRARQIIVGHTLF